MAWNLDYNGKHRRATKVNGYNRAAWSDLYRVHVQPNVGDS